MLAAGTGSRFDPSGERFKLTQKLDDGQPVIVASLRVLHRHVDTMLLVEGERGHELDEALGMLSAPVGRVHCANAYAGMGASVKAGVRASGPTDAWLIGLGDMPYISGDTIAEVVAALRRGTAIARPFYRGKPGHPVGLAHTLRAELLALPDHSGAAELLKRHGDGLVRLDVDDPGCVADIDYPSDIRRSL